MTRFHHTLIRHASVLLCACALVAALPERAVARTEITPVGSSAVLALDVWTSRGDGAVYNNGDEIAVYFRASGDCFVTIYDITTDGRTIVLFPEYPDDGFVRGGITYRLPGYYDGPALRVSGPRGIEYIHAVATLEPGAFRFHREGARYRLRAEPISGDPYAAMNDLNGALIDTRYVRATATTSFFVGSRVWYPRYSCNSCHSPAAFPDPYAVECRRYVMRAHTAHDYWWDHPYHPVFRAGVFVAPFWYFELRTMPVHRHRKVRYIDCAWGWGNWHPVHMPRVAYVHVPNRNPHIVKYREYEREYRPITWREERERRSGPTRSGTDIRTRDDATRTREDATTRTRDTRQVDASARSRDSAPVTTERSRSSAAEVTSRSREATPQVSTPPRTREAAPQVSTPTRSREATPQVSTPPRTREAAPQVSTPTRTREATPQASERSRAAQDASPGGGRSRTR
jgi:hypothetical protein